MYQRLQMWILAKSFSIKDTLKKHIHIVHEGHKDYKCESCRKSSSQAGYMKKHIHTVHEGHKDYKCESCAKSYADVWRNTFTQYIKT